LTFYVGALNNVGRSVGINNIKTNKPTYKRIHRWSSSPVRWAKFKESRRSL